MPISRPVIVLLLLALAIGIPLLNRTLGDGDGKPVTQAEPSMRTIAPSILASGSLAHENEVALTSEVIGRVTAVYVTEGDSVEQDQLVLQIDDEAFTAQLQQNEASVRLQQIAIERAELNAENLKRRRNRSQKLYKQKLLGEDAFEALDHQYNMAKVDLKSSKERLVQTQAQLQQFADQLAKTQIRAPISGVVTSLDIEVGETAISSTTNIPGSGLMTIADPSSIITEVFVDEADVADIRVGQTAEIVAIAYPDQPLKGNVEFIANTAKTEPNRRGLTFLVRIRISESNGIALRPGMSCRAAIFTETEEEVLSLPVQAIATEEIGSTKTQQHYVFVERDGKAYKQIVSVGLSDDEYQEITDGLDLDARVVTGPARTLRRLQEGEAINTDPDADTDYGKTDSATNAGG